jgi:hypothetical protein
VCLKKPRKFLFLLSLIILGSFCSQAQKNGAKVSGQVFSDSLKQELAGATVLLSNVRDSSVEKIILTDHKGKFVFSSLRPDSFILVITEVNHETLIKPLVVSNGQQLDLGSIFLHVKTNELDPITVFSRKIPILIKPDTIEFNASSFPTRPNDVVEDLLKKLPGVTVDRNGNITAHGEQITQILVDGKPFFGSDPRTASQNLPADIIDKVQVIDQRTERSRITKVDDGQTQKVINLTIRKDRNKGSFGRAYAGYGTKDHYEASVNANHFEGDKKIALVASQNNTGRADYSSGNNELGGSQGNSNGINTNGQVRMNYTNKWGKKLTIATDIGYNGNDNISDQVRNRQTVLGDSVIYYFEQTASKRSRTGFNGNLNLNYEADSFTRIIFNQSLNYFRYTSHALSGFVTSETGRKVNEGTRANDNVSTSPLWNGNLTVSRSFRKTGRALFFNLNDNISKNNSDGFIHSANYFYPLSEPDYGRWLDQYVPADNSSTGWNSAFTLNEPLSKKSSLSLNATYNSSKGHSLRYTYDWNPSTRLYDIFNDTLSSHFNNSSSVLAAGMNYNYNFNKGNISLGANWQDNRIRTVSILNDSVYQQHYASILPFASYNFSSKGKRFSLNYNYGTRAPQPLQLQKIIDNSNPLFLRLGNPALKFSSIHRVGYALNFYYQKPRISINSSGNFNFTLNNISTSTIYDKTTGVQISMPVNLDGARNGFTRLYLSKQMRIFGKNDSWYVNGSFNFNRSVSLLDYKQNINEMLNQSYGAGLRVEWGELAELSGGGTVSFQNIHYSLNPGQDYNSVLYGIDATARIIVSKHTELLVAWNQSQNSGSTPGFNRQINMVNMELSEYLNKKKNFWLKFRVYDLLKQNISVYRYSGENFIEDLQTQTLSRYFLLSLNMKFNKFKK